ncbi:alpha/beta hydrolase [Methylosinus sporium]|uniref:Alpha/beta hydrolase n=1 Tax=Methylosinus sporium TaxID=428 RepID=A0A549T671_METSR|nr:MULTISPECIES: alpha/beta hydrolase [Methylosinus]MBU3887088.1 alpha/beta hydrolase [Methylosinus sp. KRF6]TRL37373.1 alpha/beta hydrolase [Methylosinus sporium]
MNPERDETRRATPSSARHSRNAAIIVALALTIGCAVTSGMASGDSATPTSVETVEKRSAAEETKAEETKIVHADGVTELVAFDSAPFPFDGAAPGKRPFLDVAVGGRRGHRARNGGVLWADETFGDRRVLLHIPRDFDPARPATIVVFFHGFGATLARDVRDRQLVPEQISASGANAVLIAPQFAVDARDGSAGRFWERGGFRRFLDEAARRLARAYGDPAAEPSFRAMPITLVAYSGGFLPAAYSIRDMEGDARLRGVALLDAAYGELDVFARWIEKRSGFFVSASTGSTAGQNARLRQMLAARGVAFGSDAERIGRGVTFLHTGDAYSHRDYVTKAWTREPIRDLLAHMPDVVRRDVAVAAWSGPPDGDRRSAMAEDEEPRPNGR